jgi:hypothetical protein
MISLTFCRLAPTFKFISKGDIKLGNGQTINTHFLDCPNESVVQKWNLFYQTDKQYDCSSKMSSRGFAQKFLGSTRTITGQSLDSGISSSTAESVTCSIQ